MIHDHGMECTDGIFWIRSVLKKNIRVTIQILAGEKLRYSIRESDISSVVFWYPIRTASRIS